MKFLSKKKKKNDELPIYGYDEQQQQQQTKMNNYYELAIQTNENTHRNTAFLCKYKLKIYTEITLKWKEINSYNSLPSHSHT